MFTIRTSLSENINGYLSGLSSPSATDRIITFRSSPSLNSAGQTRLPTFSMMTRSSAPRSSFSIAPFICRASRWQEPPVFICTAGMPSAAIRSASTFPAMSPSITPLASEPDTPSRVFVITLVFPAPGLAIRLIMNVPASSRSARFSLAIISFASNTPSRTSISISASRYLPPASAGAVILSLSIRPGTPCRP